MDDRYWLTIESAQNGPYKLTQLQSMWRAGSITDDTLYWQEGFDEWIPLSIISDILDPQSVPTVTAAPPQSREIQPPAKRSASCAILALIAIAVVVILVVITNQKGPDQSALRTPNVSIGWSDTAVEITNTSTESWSAMTVYINGQPPFTYKWDGAAPAAGQSKTILLHAFDKKGERFDPFKYKVTEVWVGGGGYDYLSFK